MTKLAAHRIDQNLCLQNEPLPTRLVSRHAPLTRFSIW